MSSIPSSMLAPRLALLISAFLSPWSRQLRSAWIRIWPMQVKRGMVAVVMTWSCWGAAGNGRCLLSRQGKLQRRALMGSCISCPNICREDRCSIWTSWVETKPNAAARVILKRGGPVTWLEGWVDGCEGPHGSVDGLFRSEGHHELWMNFVSL